LDAKTEKGVCAIDLDTVMPGCVLHDFGDLVRTTACPVSEDETDSTTYTVSYAITSPATAAPAPTARDAADVISIYSDAYTNIALDALSAGFDDSDVSEVMIDGNATLEIDFTNFIGIDFSSNKKDASTMTRFHMDFWTASDDLVGKVFNSKFSQWGGTGGEVSAFELPINTGTSPAIVSGSWVSIDVPISDWTNAPQTRDDIAQFLITSNLDTVYVDNIYLYKEEAYKEQEAQKWWLSKSLQNFQKNKN